MSWFFLAFGAALCWAVGQIFVKKGFAHIPPLWNNVVNNLLTLVFWVPAVLWLNGFTIAVPRPLILLVILSSASLYQFFYYAISKGQISLTGTVVAGYPVITVLLSVLFLGERLTVFQYIGISCIIAGGVIVAVPERDSLSRASLKDVDWFLWGLSGAFTIGAGDFLTKVSINQIGSYTNTFFLAIAFNLLSGMNYLIDSKNRRAPKLFSRRFIPTLIGVCIHLVGALLFMFAFDRGKASLVGPVSSVYPAIVVILAVKFLNEKISPKHGTGIGVALFGLLLAGFGGL